MCTVTFKLTFPDGAVVTARSSASDSGHKWPIIYKGAVDRLPERLAEDAHDWLRLKFQKWAKELGAKFTTRWRGYYISPCNCGNHS